MSKYLYITHSKVNQLVIINFLWTWVRDPATTKVRIKNPYFLVFFLPFFWGGVRIAFRTSKRKKHEKGLKRKYFGDFCFASTGNRIQVSTGPLFPFDVFGNFSNDNASITGRFGIAGL